MRDSREWTHLVKTYCPTLAVKFKAEQYVEGLIYLNCKTSSRFPFFLVLIQHHSRLELGETLVSQWSYFLHLWLSELRSRDKWLSWSYLTRNGRKSRTSWIPSQCLFHFAIVFWIIALVYVQFLSFSNVKDHLKLNLASRNVTIKNSW